MTPGAVAAARKVRGVPPFTVLSGSPGVQVEQLPESAEITLREQAYAAVERRQRE